MSMSFLSRRLQRFSREEDGLVMTEFLIMLPLLVWTFMALFIYWDAFRTINQAQKAAYAVSDLVSRQSEVDRDFIGGMKKVMEYLTNGKQVRMRISSVQWDETNDVVDLVRLAPAGADGARARQARDEEIEIAASTAMRPEQILGAVAELRVRVRLRADELADGGMR